MLIKEKMACSCKNLLQCNHGTEFIENPNPKRCKMCNSSKCPLDHCLCDASYETGRLQKPRKISRKLRKPIPMEEPSWENFLESLKSHEVNLSENNGSRIVVLVSRQVYGETRTSLEEVEYGGYSKSMQTDIFNLLGPHIVNLYNGVPFLE